MIKKILALIIIVALSFIVCSCALLKDNLDEKSGFTKNLKQTEKNINAEDWNKAADSLHAAEMAWKKIKPVLQLDIDHDYVNEIEDSFVILDVSIANKVKIDSLTNIRIIEKKWDTIGEM